MLKIIDDNSIFSEFVMEASIDRSISFRWGNISNLISSKWKDNKIIAFIDSKVYENSTDWAELEKSHKNLLFIPTNLVESTKQVESLLACLERLESSGFSRRDDILLAIGGGVLMDLVSLAANMYRRGVAVVKVPTTLLGFVDASIGIKTGINFLGQRNRLGTYYLNYDVIYDRSLLKTLSTQLIREGLGEIFKIAIIKSKVLFELLEANVKEINNPEFYQTDDGAKIISISVQLMLEELHDNPTETNLKRCVDFGHSFSPLTEMKSISLKDMDPIPHGLAVGADCIITSIISFNRRILSEDSLKRIVALGHAINFLPSHPIYEYYDIMWASLNDMTVHRGGNQNLPIPSEIGEYIFVQDIEFDEMKSAIDIFREKS